MNLFIVPSWYPSDSNPSYGIFIKDQIKMMAHLRPDWKIGVSSWGQGSNEKLIWIKDHYKNLTKIRRHQKDTPSTINNEGFKEFYQPALTWTKRFKKGNLKEIIRCNEINYQSHTQSFGKPDVIMVQATYPGVLIGEYLSEKYDIPFHLHIRLGGFMFEQLLSDLGGMRRQTLSAISKAKLVTVTSDFHAKEIAKWVPETKTLYNPVDTQFFDVHDKNEQYVLAVGRLEHEKGFDLLIEAVAQIDGLNLKIIGGGAQRDALERKISHLKLEDRVELIGEKNRVGVKLYMQNCQFLMLPSRYETFGNVLLEAMACGKPVVATNCGGPSEIVTKDTGLISEVSVSDLKEKIVAMINSNQQYDPKLIRHSIDNKFSPEVWIVRLETQLTSAIKK
ncbi:glycosyltransferase [Ekhidna sp. MALMAid0563]|uniref:glycosyltransferase n=1 Tax=Ekhidna sp. MALMAid0563 TaxID=3143937 RepID=UPI0032DED318